MKHITITHDGITLNWSLDPRLPAGAVAVYVASDIAYSAEICPQREGEPYPYDRVVHLLSPSVTKAQAVAIWTDADTRGESVMRSANDAFIRHPDLTSLRVIVWQPQGFNGGAAGLVAWVQQHYPPVPTIEYRTIP